MTRWLLVGLVLVAPAAWGEEKKPASGGPSAATEAADEGARLRAQGLEAFRNGQITEAIKKLGEARAKGVADPETRIALGQAYLTRGMHQKALIEFSEVLRKNPNHIPANLGRAESLIGLGDARKALGPAKLVAELQPENPRAWEILGDAYAHEQLEDFEKAQGAYRKALGLDPKSRNAAMNLARALNFDKQVEEAIRVMEVARKEHPDDMLIVVKLAETYYAIRKLAKAEQLVNEALDSDPNDKEALRVQDQIQSRQAYNFWVPVIAIIAFPVVYFGVRWMKRGRVPKVKNA